MPYFRLLRLFRLLSGSLSYTSVTPSVPAASPKCSGMDFTYYSVRHLKDGKVIASIRNAQNKEVYSFQLDFAQDRRAPTSPSVIKIPSHPPVVCGHCIMRACRSFSACTRGSDAAILFANPAELCSMLLRAASCPGGHRQGQLARQVCLLMGSPMMQWLLTKL